MDKVELTFPLKVCVAKLLRKTRQQFEFYGITPPAWMFRWKNRISLLIVLTAHANDLGLAGEPAAGNKHSLASETPLPADQVVHVPAEQRALDLAYLESLHGASSTLPLTGIHLMVDLRVAQVYRERGIARYAQTLVIELARQRPDIRYSWLIEEGEMPLFEQSLAKIGRFVRVNEIPLLPRITHYLQSCIFDRSREAAELFPKALAEHQPLLAAIVYDMIPWVLPQLYLRDPSVSHSYMRAAEYLSALDQLFAISECSRIDAVAFGCHPRRVSTIYGGWHLDRFNTTLVEPPPLPASYWLYIGGDDPRKNIAALFRAFAKVRQRLPDAPALVVVCDLAPERRIELLREAKVAGLDVDGLVLTGYVPDGTMRAVIEGALATIFPSLYEGLGLPVLESYQYGRAALVSDNSSLKELAPPECRFDASKPEAIAEAVLRFHRDPAIRQASLDYAERILQMCNWKTAAGRVAAWCDAAPALPRLKEPLDIIASLPPDQSGVALYTQKTLASAPWTIRFFVPWEGDRLRHAMESLRRTRHKQRAVTPLPQILPISDYRPGQKSSIWILGNSEHHIETIDKLARDGRPHDFLYLHEAMLDDLMGIYHQRKGMEAALPKTIKNLNDCLGVIRPRNILVNSEFCLRLVQSFPNAKMYKVRKLFLPVLEVVPNGLTRIPKSTEQPLTIMHVGIVGRHKQPDQIVKACELICQTRPIRLIFAGYDTDSYLRTSGLERPWIETKEKLSDEGLVALMQEAHVGVQLRWPHYGESSAAVCQWLGLRKPVIATAGGSFDEFAGAVWLVPPEAGPEGLAAAILEAAERGVVSELEDFLSRRTIAAWLSAFREALEAEHCKDTGKDRETAD
jgi:glycosyltransferase involved in cell wall biosynthesis